MKKATIQKVKQLLQQVLKNFLRFGKKPPHITPAYRRALWIVVLLNVGYGVAEMIGEFFTDSLKRIEISLMFNNQ